MLPFAVPTCFIEAVTMATLSILIPTRGGRALLSRVTRFLLTSQNFGRRKIF